MPGVVFTEFMEMVEDKFSFDVADEIMELSGVESKFGSGSTFWFQIPFPPDHAGSEMSEQPTRKPRGCIVCFSEFEPVARVYAETLEDLGFTVDHARSLEQVREHLATHSYEAVLASAVSSVQLDDLLSLEPDLSVPLLLATTTDAAVSRTASNLVILPKPLAHDSVERALNPDAFGERHDGDHDAVSDAGVGGEDVSGERPLKVLIVEDIVTNQLVMSGYLSTLGHDADIAADGRHALAAGQKTGYDLVFMDMQMPEMDGLEATREIRKLPGAASQVPIVAMTANAMAQDEESCLQAGMNGFLSKPVRIDQIRATLAQFAATAADRR